MDNLLDLTKRKAEIAKNSKPARDVVASLLDADSFVETDAFLFTQNDLANASALGEGVVTGYGTVNGSPVYVFCQNFAVLKGGLGRAHAKKIVKCMQAAYRTGTPLVSILHTAGARLGEGVTALDGYGEIMRESAKLSGYVPQISVVNGDCFGQLSCLAALSDFTFFMKDASVVLGAPQVVAAKSNSGLTPQQIGGAAASEKNGLASFTVGSVAELKTRLSGLLSMLPPESGMDVPVADLNRQAKVTAFMNAKKMLAEVFDEGTVLDVSDQFAPHTVTALAKLGGAVVGVVANNFAEGEEYLSGDDCRKAARFIRMLDCFNLPLVTFCNCKGTSPSVKEEQQGLAKDLAQLMYAVSEAGVPKLAVAAGFAVGAGYTALCSKSLGYDYTFAFDHARISTLADAAGAEIVYGEEIAKAKDPVKAREEAAKRYADYDANPLFAAESGCVDNIIAPASVRQYLISALQMTESKTEAFPVKKHGNMPL